MKRRSGGAVAAAALALVLLYAWPGSGGASDPRPSVVLHPAPQSMQVERGSFPLGNAVTLVTPADTDRATVGVVTTALRAAGVKTIRRAAHAPPAAAGLVVVIARSGQRSAAVLGLSVSVPRRPDGYALRTAVRGHARLVVLAGFDSTGQFYAAQTFKQLVQRARSLPLLTIRDWPTYITRGVVEGFYGRPWTQQARLSMLDFLAARKLGTFVYMPKDDTALRSGWRNALPKPEQHLLASLVVRARSDHVALRVGISPGDSICYSSSSDRAALTDKLNALWELGIRGFVLAFDDVDATRAPCSSDRSRFGTADSGRGAEQADLGNFVDDWLRDRRGALRLWVVPSEYAGGDSTPLKQGFAPRLHHRILVQWTGMYSASFKVSAANVAAARTAYGHDIVLWDNRLVNDSAPGYLSLGRVGGLPRLVPTGLLGLTTNPMNQPEASRLGLFSIADYAWNSTAFDAEASWRAAVAALAGPVPAVRRALTAFADANSAPFNAPQQAPLLAAEIERFWTDWNAHGVTAAPPLRAALTELARSPSTLRAELRDRAFLTEVEPWLRATTLWARAAIAGLNSMVAHRSGTPGEATDIAAARSLRTRAMAIAVSGPKGVQAVTPAGGVIDTFVHNALQGYRP